MEYSFTIHCSKNEVFHYGFFKSMSQNPKFLAELVTLTEEIRNENFTFCEMIYINI